MKQDYKNQRRLKMLLLVMLALFIGTAAKAQDWGKWCYKDFNTPGQYNYQIPVGCTKVIVECIGGGGAGGAIQGEFHAGGVGSDGGCNGGGGAGAYARSGFYVDTLPNSSRMLNIYVARGGVSIYDGEFRHGEASYVKYGTSTKAYAAGGESVEQNVNNAGLGAKNGWVNLTSNWRPEKTFGDVVYNGGNGGVFTLAGVFDFNKISGSGGGAGGGSRSGSNAEGPIISIFTRLSGNVGEGGEGGTLAIPINSDIVWLTGGDGGEGRQSSNGWGPGYPGQFPGGGGGGARAQFPSDHENGGAGGNGRVRVWFYVEVIPNETLAVTSNAPDTCCYGQPITFSANSSNTLGSLSYRWSNGSTGRTPTFNVVSSGTYSVTMTDDYSAYSSGACAITKTASTDILVYPAINPGNIVGGSASFNKGDAAPTIVNAMEMSGGDGHKRYQWFYSLNNGSEMEISGATGSSYTPGNSIMNTPGRYTFIRKAKDGRDCATWHPAPSTYKMIVSENVIASGQWNQWCYTDYEGGTDGDISYAFYIPQDCDSLMVEAIGGGGGGGGACGTSIHCGGGGGGGYSQRNNIVVSNSDPRNLSITVGAGGTHGTASREWVSTSAVTGYFHYTSSNGGDGGTSRVIWNGDTLVEARGGSGAGSLAKFSGGKDDGETDGGAGGGAAHGTINHTGATGHNGNHGDHDSDYSGGGGGAAGENGDGFPPDEYRGGNGNGVNSGRGGNGQLDPTGGGNGHNGWESGGHGGGGGGGFAGTANYGGYPGGWGAAGFVRVWYHINAPVVVSISPTSGRFCPGSSETFTATPTGIHGTASYHWSTGSSSSSIAVSSSGQCCLTVTDTYASNCSLSLSGCVNIETYDALNAGAITSGTGTICVGEVASTISEISVSKGAGNLSYRWKDNSGYIAGIETKDFTPGSEYVNVPGTYTFKREVAGSECGQTWVESSGSFTLVVKEKPTANDDVFGYNKDYSGSISCNVLGNDSYVATCATPEVEIAVNPTNGTAVWDPVNRVVVYTPSMVDQSDDEFQYILYCGNSECGSLATVHIKAVSLDLDCPVEAGANTYRFANAHAQGYVRSIAVGFIEDPENCSITLPTLPAGWTSTGNVYFTFINVPENTPLSDVDSVLHNITFQVPNNTLKEISVMIDATEQPGDIFYNSTTQHYYQYVKFDNVDNITAADPTNPDYSTTWMDCYARAMNKTYLGRKGYLATLTSLEEDKFITRVAGPPAWVGATRLPNTVDMGTLYYDPTQFQTSHEATRQDTDKWYWACGPEKGEVLLNGTIFSGVSGSTDFYYAQRNAAGDTIYSNWAPNEPNSSSGESCLTILKLSDAYTGYQHHTNRFSWNDKSYRSNYINAPSDYSSKGYMVEYGDRTVGNSHADVYETQARQTQKIGNKRDTISAELTILNNRDVMCTDQDTAYLRVELHGKAPFTFTIKASADTVEHAYVNYPNNIIYVMVTPNPISDYWIENLSDASSLNPCYNEPVIYPGDTVTVYRDLYKPTFSGIIPEILATGTGCSFAIPDIAEQVKAIVSDDATPKDELVVVQSPAAGTVFTATTDVKVVVTDGCGRKDSITVKVVRPDMPVANVTNGGNVCYNGTTTLTANPSGTSPFAYQWSNGAVNAENVLTELTTTGTQWAYVTVTDANGCTVKDSASYTVYHNVSAGQILSTGKTICVNGTAETIASNYDAAGGDNAMAYQWFVGDDEIEGANSATYTPAANYTETPGEYVFTRKAKDGSCHAEWVTSTGSYTLTVEGLTSAGTISATGEAVCQNSTASPIEVVEPATAQGAITYEWYKDDVIIPGANADTYTPSTATAGTFVYTRKAGVGSCSAAVASTNSYTLTVYPLATISATGDAQCVTDANDGKMVVEVSGGTPDYALSCGTKNHDLAADGDYTFTGLADGEYTVTATDANGCVATLPNAVSISPSNDTIRILSNSHQWTYDNAAHTDNGFTVLKNGISYQGTSGTDLNIGGDLVVNVTVTGSITNVGFVTNTLVLNTLTESSTDVTCQYPVSISEGSLRITDGDAEQIGLTCPSGSDIAKKYDGEPLFATATATAPGTTIQYSLDSVAWNTVVPSITDADTQLVYVRALNPNYETASCKYYLSVAKRVVTLTSATDSRCFIADSALTNPNVTVSGDGFVASQGVANYNFTGTQTEIGHSSNTFTYTLKANTAADNYTITTVAGTLSVDSCGAHYIALTVPTTDASRKYDGTALQPAAIATATEGGSVDVLYSVDAGSTWSSEVPSLTNVGTKQVKVKATCSGYDDVEGNYTLQVLPRDLILTSCGDSKTYDGNLLQCTNVTVGGDSLVVGETVSFNNFASITNVDTVFNTFEVLGSALTNYNVQRNYGKLIISPANGLVVADTPEMLNKNRKYDGTALWAEAASATPAEGTTFQYSVAAGLWSDTIPYITHVGTKTVSVRAVNPNYYPSDPVSYTLTVSKRNVTLTSESDTIPYSNTPLTNHNVTVSGDGFAVGEGLTYSDFATITNPGSISNTFLYEAAANTLLSDYAVTSVFGILVVEGVNCFTMTMPALASTTFTYDGTSHSADDVAVSGTCSNPVNVEYSTDGGTTWTTTKPSTTHVADSVQVLVRASSIGTDTLIDGYTLKALPREVTLSSGSPVQAYNGAKLSGSGDLTISAGSFIGTEGVTNVVYTDTIIGVGSITNRFNYEFNADTRASDYVITTEYGTLTVNKCADCITINAPDPNHKLYDGTPLSGAATTSSTATGDVVSILYSIDNGATWSPSAPSLTEADTIQVKAKAFSSNSDTTFLDYQLYVSAITDLVTVNVKGHHNTFAWDGTEHTVSGYQLLSDNSYYNIGIGARVSFTGDSTVSLTSVDTAYMELLADNFSNISRSFTNVSFNLEEDGYIAVVGQTGPVFHFTDNIRDYLEYTGRDLAYFTCDSTTAGVWNPTVDAANGVASLTYTVSGATTAVNGENTTLEGQKFQYGVTTVRWFAVDLAGNYAICNQIITIQDTQKPNVSPIEDYTMLMDWGVTSHTHAGESWDPIATDNVQLASLTCTLSGASTGTYNTLSGVTFDQGATIVSWTARDIAGNDSTITFNVFIGDNLSPCIGCTEGNPYDTTGVSCETIGTNGSVGVGVDEGATIYTHTGNAWDVTAADNDRVASLYYTLDGATTTITDTNTTLNGQVFPIGATYVTWHALDPTGNEAICVITVTVGDQEPPCIGCTPEHPLDPTSGVNCDSVVANAPSHDADTIYVMTDVQKNYYTHSGNGWNVTAADNVSSVTLTYSLSGATTTVNGENTTIDEQKFNYGLTEITWTATDAGGNSSNCSFWVRVDDDQQPCIGCTAEDPFNDNAGRDCEDVVSNASGVNDTITVYAQNNLPYYQHSGEAWNVTAGDNVGVKSLTFAVSGKTTIVTDTNTTLNGQQFPIGTTKVTWTATDSSDNTLDCSFYVLVKDNQIPCIGCTDDTYPDPDLDNGRTCASIVADTTHVVDTIAVKSDAGLYTYTHPDTTDWDITAADNSGVLNITYVLSGATAGTGPSLADVTFNYGLTEVKWVAVDTSDNGDTCSFYVRVSDDQAPIIGATDEDCGNADATNGNNCTKIGSPTVYTDDYQAYYTHSNDTADWNITACDNSGIAPQLYYTVMGATTTVTAPNTTLEGQVFQSGVTTVRWYAEDNDGNVDSCDFTVTVNDNLKPKYTRPADDTLCRLFPSYAYDIDSTITGSPTDVRDNLTPAEQLTVWHVDDTAGVAPEYVTITRTWHVKDLAGNDSTQVQYIRIRPAISQPNCAVLTPHDTTIVLYYSVGDTLVDYLRKPTLTSYMPAEMVDFTYNITGANQIPGRYETQIDAEYKTHDFEWTVKDQCGFSIKTTQVLTVQYPECTTVTDVDGNVYPAKRIWHHCWTAENMRTTHYASALHYDAPAPAMSAPFMAPTPMSSPIPVAVPFDNGPANTPSFGLLYSWYSAVNVPEGDNESMPATVTSPTGTHVQGVCPEGWVLPTPAEYENMNWKSNGANHAKDANINYWLPGMAGEAPLSGFNARGAGYFNYENGRYEDLLGAAYFWTYNCTPGSPLASGTQITYYCENMLNCTSLKGNRYSVRCIRKW